ncbi:HNH endonuclease [Paenirhodobacter sp. CAU 1674]|uniref:HNH endonuclease n=1 Tax=Paenirhodobacter sp. CAU 1674 TaxID=3032596 RepID=UPI0023DBA56B|nr:HNH endonuclease [Paenirhodobacter sp. CAU 1674]MDF2141226.1 HNH endonuclease [Paenirhodobacter sp. CAU 1674]
MKGRAISYSALELVFIQVRADLPRRELHAEFCRHFGRQDVTLDQLKALCKRKGWLTGRSGCFPKGHVPANKGKQMPFHPNSARTRFQKGQRPINKYDVGHETVDRDGYVRICVDRPNPWTGHRTHMAFKHRELWVATNGPVPDGHRLKCIDGNKRNTDPTNWEAVPMALAPRLNGKYGRGYDGAPPDLKPTILAVAKLEHRVRELKREARK